MCNRLQVLASFLHSGKLTSRNVSHRYRRAKTQIPFGGAQASVTTETKMVCHTSSCAASWAGSTLRALGAQS
jgi:hypothetical protein